MGRYRWIYTISKVQALITYCNLIKFLVRSLISQVIVFKKRCTHCKYSNFIRSNSFCDWGQVSTSSVLGFSVRIHSLLGLERDHYKEEYVILYFLTYNCSHKVTRLMKTEETNAKLEWSQRNFY